MLLSDAVDVAVEVMELLAPACEDVVTAGSVRRNVDNVKDIEIVYRPRMVPESDVDDYMPMAYLFDARPEVKVPATYRRIRELIDDGFWTWDEEVVRKGPRYQRLIHGDSGVVVELFRADEVNWGYILLLRTGPADFNRLIVTKQWDRGQWGGGFLPVDVRCEGGYVKKRGLVVPVPDEHTFFRIWGLPFIEPEDRSGLAS